MNPQILGDKKRVRYDESLIDVVNRKAANGELKDVVVPQEEIVLPNSRFPVVDLDKLELPFSLWAKEIAFSQSLQKLKDENRHRHLRPAEYYTLLFENLKDPINYKYKDIVKLLENHSIWLSAAINFDPYRIEVLLDPKNWGTQQLNGEKYSFLTPEKLRPKLEYGQNYPLEDFPEDFIELMYGRKLKDFPEEVLKTDPRISVKELHYFIPVGNGIEHTLSTISLERATYGVKEK